MMNKKGALVLRDLMFMLIVFTCIMTLATIYVRSMASEYSNVGMENEYYDGGHGVGGLGDLLFSNLSEDIPSMQKATVTDNESVISSLTSPTGIITGAGKILITIFKIPSYVGNSLGIIANALHLPDPLPTLIQNTVNFLIYSVIIFVIISSLLKGGKI